MNLSNWQSLIKKQQFNDLVIQWNQKINLVSRKKNNVYDLIEDSEIFLREIDTDKELKILDLGTGGGFPGIVLAISLPKAKIVLVDSIQKKINAVQDIISKLELTNAIAVCSRAEELVSNYSKLEILGKTEKSFDYIVCRSVALLQDLCKWSEYLIKNGGELITIKGGDIKGEIKSAKKLSIVKDIIIKPYDGRFIIKVIFK
jgi:16S rRNA (guanine527-N7)-methyltransferase